MSINFSTPSEEVFKQKLVLHDSLPTLPVDISTCFEILECSEWIKEKELKNVALQFPNSLLCWSTQATITLSKVLQDSVKLSVLADTNYGSCCVDEVAAEHIKADGIIHFGETCLSPTRRLPVLYVFTRGSLELDDAVVKLLEVLPSEAEQYILTYDTKFAHHMEMLHEMLSNALDKPVSLTRLSVPGAVTSSLSKSSLLNQQSSGDSLSHTYCGRKFPNMSPSNTNKNFFVYIGGQGVTLTNQMLRFPNCPFYRYDPSTCLALRETVNMNKLLMKRYYCIEKAKDATTIGILVGTLSVRGCLEIIERLKELINAAGKKYYVLLVGKLNPAKLANFPDIEVFVLVSCPEGFLFDSKDFYQTIISPYECEIAFNKAREWTGDYLTDFSLLLPGAGEYVPLPETSSDVPDVSLISGNIRYAEECAQGGDARSSALVPGDPKTVSLVYAPSLSNKTWTGLDPMTGETPVEAISEGLRGIAMGYDTEKSLYTKEGIK